MRGTRHVIACGAAFVLAAGSAGAQTGDARTERAGPIACLPLSPAAMPEAALRVVGPAAGERMLFGAGDRVVVMGRGAAGLRAGDAYALRRVLRDRLAESERHAPPLLVQTVAAARVAEVRPGAAVLELTEVCDGASEGDFVGPLDPAPSGTGLEGSPDFASPGRVILGADGRQLGGRGDFMVIDRGAGQGLVPGQLITIFRPAPDGVPAPPVGTARVQLVTDRTATVRIERSVDAVYVGDLVALHR